MSITTTTDLYIWHCIYINLTIEFYIIYIYFINILFLCDYKKLPNHQIVFLHATRIKKTELLVVEILLNFFIAV